MICVEPELIIYGNFFSRVYFSAPEPRQTLCQLVVPLLPDRNSRFRGQPMSSGDPEGSGHKYGLLRLVNGVF